ncbi:MAG: transcription elongation factor GreA [Cellvibrionales bacterium]|nr:transcription elongation factor GreA [Cellvibrionales bacterium]
MNRVPMTVAGERALRAELAQLKKVDRPRISAAIAEARAHGDLKENAEYHAAREQQAFTEGRIQAIEASLARAQVIDISNIPPSDKVIFGATVRLLNLETDETVRYQIVGEDEADVRAGKIAVTTPIARGLIGKEAGDTVQIQTPGGATEFEIEQVEYL